MGIMQGRRGVVMGVANDHSLAWGISQALAEQGAQIAFTYQSEVLEKRVRPLAQSLGCEQWVYPCDVSQDADIDTLFSTLQKTWGKIDFILHAIAFAEKEDLKGAYVTTSRENFAKAMDISCYSFTAVVQKALPILAPGASLLSLTYEGSNRVIPHYNVMGVAKAALESSVRYLATDLGPKDIRVNALSAGPVRTLASAGIGDFRYILKWNADNAPLRRNVTLDDVGKSGLYLLSPLSSGVTGEIHNVSCGYHTVGMKAVDSVDCLPS